MKHTLFQSLVFRFLLGGELLLVLLFGFQSYNSQRILQNFALKNTHTQILQLSETLNLALSPLVGDAQYTLLNEFFNGLIVGDEHGIIYIALLDENGRVLSASANLPNPLPEPYQDLQQQLKTGTVHIQQPILLANNRTGQVRFGLSTQIIQNIINNSLQDDMIVMLLGLCIAIFLLLLLGLNVRRQLRNLVVSSQKLAAGDLNSRVGIKGNNEFSDLAHSFNKMADAIASNTKTLQHRQGLLEQAQAVAHLGNLSYNPTTRLFEFSKESYRILGLAPGSEISYEQFFNRLHPDDQMLFNNTFSPAYEDRTIHKQFRIIIDGKVKWLQVIAKTLHSTNGVLTTIEGTLQDISILKFSELHLFEQNKQYLSLLENINGISWQLDLASARFSYISPNVTRLLGYQASDWATLDSWLAMVLEEDREFARSYCSTETEAGRDHVFEYRMLKKSGEIIWVMDMVTVIKNDLGMPVKLAGFIVDITEKQKAAQELRKKDNYQQALLNNFPFLVWLKNTDGEFLAVNQPFATAAGFDDLSHLIGKTDFDIWPKDLATGYRQDDVEVMKQLRKKELIEEVSNQGKRKWYETFKAPVINDKSELLGTVGFARDITERKATEEKLQLAASVFVHASEGISITDANGNFLDVNASFTEITGYTRDEVLRQHHSMLKSGRHDEQFYQTMWQQLTQEGQWSGEVWKRRKSGELYLEFMSINVVHDNHGEIQNFVALFNDITTQKEYQQKLEYIAHYDVLTKLPNRVLLADRLNQAMEMTNRNQRLLAVAYMDLDGFKKINDQHGHDIGDQLLEILAARFNDILRKEDTISRLGGDEFVAVFVDLQEKQDCFQMLNRLLQASSQPFYIKETFLQVSGSIGVSFYPQGELLDPDQLLRQADQAMYQAKLSGKNRFHIFDSEQDKSVKSYHESLDSIRHALSNDEFLLYYQPKVNMKTGQVLGVEALIRWLHPEKGLLSPESFLPVVENDPLILDIGVWVLQTALSQLSEWQAAGLKLSISVNISPKQLQDEQCVNTIASMLNQFPNLEKNSLQLEILESSTLHDITLVSDVIHACNNMGVSFALDDFGTGYSSLTYLKQLPASTLKVDRSFVRDVLDDPDDLAILEGIIGLSSAFQRTIIAEGVETEAHGTLLLQLGCQIAQGYGIAHPMPAAELSDWLTHWRPYPQWMQTKRIPRKHTKLLLAGVEYRSWIKNIEEGFLNTHTPSSILLMCAFEKWYYGNAQQIYGNLECFKAIQAEHRATIDIVKQMPSIRFLNDKKALQAHIQAMYRQRDKILLLLQDTLSSTLEQQEY